MEPHQQRVVDEMEYESSKLEKLELFINGSKFLTVPEDEQWRLRMQMTIMRSFVLILNERIRHF